VPGSLRTSARLRPMSRRVADPGTEHRRPSGGPGRIGRDQALACGVDESSLGGIVRNQNATARSIDGSRLRPLPGRADLRSNADAGTTCAAAVVTNERS